MDEDNLNLLGSGAIIKGFYQTPLNRRNVEVG